MPNIVPEKCRRIVAQLYDAYREVAKAPREEIERLFTTLQRLIQAQCAEPFNFEPFHKLMRTPFDYYQFGIDFIQPLVDQEHSSLRGLDNLAACHAALERGDNVIFLANHQSEADPQAISILLQHSYPEMGEQMLFVAGERVVTDPLAVPFSRGRNLLCIYSKRYIDHPPEEKELKQRHNKRTMQMLRDLLAEGGKAIYVAPSGGRDRIGSAGRVEVAPFDPHSVEMFVLMAHQASHPTHFYPMALKTYDIMPPPRTVQRELGEDRLVQYAPIHLAIGSRLSLEPVTGDSAEEKRSARERRAEHIHQLVVAEFSTFPA